VNQDTHSQYVPRRVQPTRRGASCAWYRYVKRTQIRQGTSGCVDFPLRATRLETAQRLTPDMSQDDRHYTLCSVDSTMTSARQCGGELAPAR